MTQFIRSLTVVTGWNGVAAGAAGAVSGDCAPPQAASIIAHSGISNALIVAPAGSFRGVSYRTLDERRCAKRGCGASIPPPLTILHIEAWITAPRRQKHGPQSPDILDAGLY